VNRRLFLQTLGAAAAPLVIPGCASVPADVLRLRGGRQLFVDDHLIADTNLTRVYHQARYIEGGPVLQPDRTWEEAGTETACAMPYSDGIVFDPRDRLFKLWYLGGMTTRQTCLAISKDAHHWEKPDWGIVAGTNIVWPPDKVHGRDSHTVIRDPHDAVYPYKMQSSASGTSTPPQWLLGSADGLHWKLLHETPPTGDRTTMFYNPFSRKWIFSIRAGGDDKPRHRLYVESDSFIPHDWNPIYWTGADAADTFNPIANGRPPQLYSLDGIAYETLILGLFTIFRGDLNDRPKLNDICVGFSRDGFNWHRPDRRPFIGLGEAGSWNYGNVQPAGGCCVVIGDELAFFVSGRAGVPGTDRHGACSTGMAILRRDGFASLEGSGAVTTPPVVFEGRHLFVNASVEGELRCEILDANEEVLVPATACVPLTGDATRHAVKFTNLEDLSALSLSSGSQRPLRFRFRLDRGKLYAFWISQTSAGRSGGYLGAGGPEGNDEGRDYVDN
jgi:hypothetical protein